MRDAIASWGEGHGVGAGGGEAAGACAAALDCERGAPTINANATATTDKPNCRTSLDLIAPSFACREVASRRTRPLYNQVHWQVPTIVGRRLPILPANTDAPVECRVMHWLSALLE